MFGERNTGCTVPCVPSPDTELPEVVSMRQQMMQANRSSVVARCLIAALVAACGVQGQSNAWWSRALEQRNSTVTLQELRHAVPQAAREEMKKAEKWLRKNDPGTAAEHLRKAIGADPEFVAARNALALCLMDKDPRAAIGQLEAAIRSAPRQAVLFHNLTIAYLAIQDLDAAENAARTTESLGLRDTEARLALGWVLIKKGQYTAEALSLVKSASGKYPVAHLLTARVLIGQGHLQQARTFIRAYESSGDEGFREYAKSWTASLDAMEQEISTRQAARDATPTTPAILAESKGSILPQEDRHD